MNSAQTWVAFITILRKEIKRFMRIWTQTLLPPASTMTLYFLIFGTLIGSRIGEMQGFDYMDFVVPGLIMMSVITSSYANVVSSFFGAKFQRFVEEILVSPMSNSTLLWGYVLGGVARGLMVGVIVTCLSLFFTELKIYNGFVVVGIVVLTSVMFSLAGFINAVFANSFDDVNIVPTFILTPLTYLGGVFFSISMLPEFWQGVAQLNPMLYIVNVFRYGMLGISDVNVVFAFSMVGVFTLIAYGVAMYLLHTGTRLRQ